MEIIDYDILEDIRQEQLTQTVIFRYTDEERNNILKKYGLNPDFMNDFNYNLEFQRTQ
jgi:hypothetical protein